MKKKELFEKVYIKSEADLPKENGYYFYKNKESNGPGSGMLCFTGDKERWLKYVDWYLRPLNSDIQE